LDAARASLARASAWHAWLATLLVALASIVAANIAAHAADRDPVHQDTAHQGAPHKDFDYYALVLGWAPSYCATGDARRRNDPECTSRRRFVLHGLWPQYRKGWPQDCWRGRRPWVPQNVIEEMRDIMPSKGLVIHEYRTHGTCAGLNPEQYFGVARQLYERIAIPDALADETSERHLSAEAIEDEFLRANPWLKQEMISVTCRRGALLDVRVCFAPDLVPIACTANEETRACHASDVTLNPGTRR
jgi:ribonuclease T2